MVAHAKSEVEARRKVKNLWARFLALGNEQLRLNASAIGKKSEQLSWLTSPNYFQNDGIRRARAIQLLQDIQALMQDWNLSQQESLG